jgi:hypothetical protein
MADDVLTLVHRLVPDEERLHIWLTAWVRSGVTDELCTKTGLTKDQLVAAVVGGTPSHDELVVTTMVAIAAAREASDAAS